MLFILWILINVFAIIHSILTALKKKFVMLNIRPHKMVDSLKKDSKPEESCIYLSLLSWEKPLSMVQNPGTLPKLRNLRRALSRTKVAIIYTRKYWRGEECTKILDICSLPEYSTKYWATWGCGENIRQD